MGDPIERLTKIFCVALAAVLLAGAPARAAENDGGPVAETLPVHVEAPDDPPAATAAREDPSARTPGRRARRAVQGTLGRAATEGAVGGCAR